MSDIIEAFMPNPITDENSNVRKCCPDKQIEEMATAIEKARIKATDTTNSMNYGFGGWYAKELYNAGYRKSTDLAEEIFVEIDKLAKEGGVIWTNYASAVLTELKKKYAESENNNG